MDLPLHGAPTTTDLAGRPGSPIQREVLPRRWVRQGLSRWELITDDILAGTEHLAPVADLAGPVRDLGSLSARERVELLGLVSYGRSDERHPGLRREDELWDRCPYLTVGEADLDVDQEALGGLEAARAITAQVASELREAYEDLTGELLRAWWSGGHASSGVHLEHGPLSKPCLDAPARLDRRWRELALGMGWTDHGEDMWHPTHGAAVKLDLRSVRNAKGRGRLIRVAGGLYKDGLARKEPWPDEAPPSPVNVERLPRAPVVEFRAAKRTWKPKPRPEYVPAKWSHGRAPELSKVLQGLRLTGDNHRLRLALCAVGQQSGLLGRAAWVDSLARGLGDRQDADAAWVSTRARLAADQPTLGRGWAWQHLGAWTCLSIAEAVADDADRPLLEVWRRLWGSRTGKDLAAKLEPHLDDETNRGESLARRARRAQVCMRFEARQRCTACHETRCSCMMSCQWREVCPCCLLRHAEQVIAALESDPDWHVKDGYYLRWADHDTWDEAMVTRRRCQDQWRPGAYGRPVSILGPLPPRGGVVGATRVLFINRFHTVATPWVRAGLDDVPQDRRGGEDMKPRPWKVVRDAVARQLLARGCAVSDLARTDLTAAAELARQLYRRHEAPGRNTQIKYPSRAKLRDIAREKAAQRRAEDPDACPCPDQVAATWDVIDIQEQVYVAMNEEWPPSLADLADKYGGANPGLGVTPRPVRAPP